MVFYWLYFVMFLQQSDNKKADVNGRHLWEDKEELNNFYQLDSPISYRNLNDAAYVRYHYG